MSNISQQTQGNEENTITDIQLIGNNTQLTEVSENVTIDDHFVATKKDDFHQKVHGDKTDLDDSDSYIEDGDDSDLDKNYEPGDSGSTTTTEEDDETKDQEKSADVAQRSGKF